MLKADFHMHSSEDWHDRGFISYSAKELIDHLARKGFEVASITHHNHVHYSKALKAYAAKKGILLIPGAEPRIEGKDVLLVNVTNEDLARLKTLDDLDDLPDHVIKIAPHPYFFLDCCLKDELVRKIKTFDAIEYSHYYTKALLSPIFKRLNGNEKAAAVAKRYKKPLVGTSDGHKLYEFGTTFTWVDSEKETESFVKALKKGKVKLHAEPMPLHLFARRTASAIAKDGLWRRVLRAPHAPNIDEEEFFKKLRR